MRNVGRRTLMNTGLAALAAVALAGGAQAATPYVPTGAADLIVYNAKVVTVDPGFSIARAFAVKDGRFTAVGDDAAIQRLAGPNTRRVDMGGKTVLPGFNDSHVHLSGGMQHAVRVDLSQAASVPEILNLLRARVAASQPGEWIVGTRGWWEYEMAEKRKPTLAELDSVSPNNPLTIPGPHYTLANSVAMRLGGITRDTPDPQGGEIWKDEKGEPSGLLMDNAGRFVSRFYPRPTPEQQYQGMKSFLSLVNSNGLTSVGDPGASPAAAAMYRQLYDKGDLTVRVDFSYSVDPTAHVCRDRG